MEVPRGTGREVGRGQGQGCLGARQTSGMRPAGKGRCEGGHKVETTIGEAAGKIWKALNVTGFMGRAQLAKATGLSNDLLNQGVGWLAREGKLASAEQSKIQGFKLKK
jgi:hypothetical protein